MAGFDTTANTMTFVAMLLAKYPHVQDKLRNELQERISNNQEGKLSYQDIIDFKYLEAVTAGNFDTFIVQKKLFIIFAQL